MQRELADRDKIMQSFVMNTEDQKNLQHRCLITSYKSKLTALEKKVDNLKKQNQQLKKENKEMVSLKENDQILRDRVVVL